MMIIAGIVAVAAPGVWAQTKAERTSSARAAYGNAVEEFRAHKKRNSKAKKKARKSAKRKKARNNKASVFRGRPF